VRVGYLESRSLLNIRRLYLDSVLQTKASPFEFAKVDFN
jgi:hypothetical protein